MDRPAQTSSNQLLDRKLKKVSAFKPFARSIVSSAVAEARKRARNGNGNGNGNAQAVDLQIATTLHVQAEPGDDVLQISIDTPTGRQTIYV